MPTSRTALAAVAAAALLVLSGCAGPIANGTDAPAAGAGATPADGTTVGGDAGTVEFYVSDERNAIEDFRHLNVTITKVGLHRASSGEDAEETEAPTDTEEAEAPTDTEEPTEVNETEANATVTAPLTPTPAPTRTAGEEAERDENEEAEAERDEDEAADGEGDGKWVEYEVEATVDLTELQGANAAKLDVLAAPSGSYDEVFVYVDGIDATLENGEQVDVKLPSSRLHVNKGFTVDAGSSVSFVFDISVHKAGRSGKYILKPVVGQSGTGDEVEIEDDQEDGTEGSGDDERGRANETEDDPELTAEFQGPVEPGEQATVKVTGADGPVAGATVQVNGETVGTTDDAGTVTFTVPADAAEVEVEVTKGDAEVELSKPLEGGGAGAPSLRAPA